MKGDWQLLLVGSDPLEELEPRQRTRSLDELYQLAAESARESRKMTGSDTGVSASTRLDLYEVGASLKQLDAEWRKREQMGLSTMQEGKEIKEERVCFEQYLGESICAWGINAEQLDPLTHGESLVQCSDDDQNHDYTNASNILDAILAQEKSSESGVLRGHLATDYEDYREQVFSDKASLPIQDEESQILRALTNNSLFIDPNCQLTYTVLHTVTGPEFGVGASSQSHPGEALHAHSEDSEKTPYYVHSQTLTSLCLKFMSSRLWAKGPSKQLQNNLAIFVSLFLRRVQFANKLRSCPLAHSCLVSLQFFAELERFRIRNECSSPTICQVKSGPPSNRDYQGPTTRSTIDRVLRHVRLEETTELASLCEELSGDGNCDAAPDGASQLAEDFDPIGTIYLIARCLLNRLHTLKAHLDNTREFVPAVMAMTEAEYREAKDSVLVRVSSVSSIPTNLHILLSLLDNSVWTPLQIRSAIPTASMADCVWYWLHGALSADVWTLDQCTNSSVATNLAAATSSLWTEWEAKEGQTKRKGGLFDLEDAREDDAVSICLLLGALGWGSQVLRDLAQGIEVLARPMALMMLILGKLAPEAFQGEKELSEIYAAKRGHTETTNGSSRFARSGFSHIQQSANEVPLPLRSISVFFEQFFKKNLSAIEESFLHLYFLTPLRSQSGDVQLRYLSSTPITVKNQLIPILLWEIRGGIFSNKDYDLLPPPPVPSGTSTIDLFGTLARNYSAKFLSNSVPSETEIADFSDSLENYMLRCPKTQMTHNHCLAYPRRQDYARTKEWIHEAMHISACHWWIARNCCVAKQYAVAARIALAHQDPLLAAHLAKIGLLDATRQAVLVSGKHRDSQRRELLKCFVQLHERYANVEGEIPAALEGIVPLFEQAYLALLVDTGLYNKAIDLVCERKLTFPTGADQTASRVQANSRKYLQALAGSFNSTSPHPLLHDVSRQEQLRNDLRYIATVLKCPLSSEDYSLLSNNLDTSTMLRRLVLMASCESPTIR